MRVASERDALMNLAAKMSANTLGRGKASEGFKVSGFPRKNRAEIRWGKGAKKKRVLSRSEEEKKSRALHNAGRCRGNADVQSIHMAPYFRRIFRILPHTRSPSYLFA